MKLYHYTPKSNYQEMLVSQCINPGAVALPEGAEAKKFAISLTKSTSGEGLGIPTGREIPVSIFDRLVELDSSFKEHCLINGKRYQIDHSAIRIEIELDVSKDLISARQFYSGAPRILGSLAVVASQPFGIAHLSMEEVDALIAQMTQKRMDAISSGWWYFRGAIPWSQVTKVAEKQPAGYYKDIWVRGQ